MFINILRSPISGEMLKGYSKYVVQPTLSLDFTKQLYVAKV